MSLSLLMDVHIRWAVTDGLRRRGVDVLSAQEDGSAQLDDASLLDRATSLGRVLFSQDDDLLAEATRRQRAGEPFSGVIYASSIANHCRPGNSRSRGHRHGLRAGRHCQSRGVPATLIDTALGRLWLIGQKHV